MFDICKINIIIRKVCVYVKYLEKRKSNKRKFKITQDQNWIVHLEMINGTNGTIGVNYTIRMQSQFSTTTYRNKYIEFKLEAATLKSIYVDMGRLYYRKFSSTYDYNR